MDNITLVYLSQKCNKPAPHRNVDYDKMLSVSQNANFSEWLQSEMDQRGWSQSDCARAADLNRAVIDKLLNGKCRPQPSTLAAIARAFRLPVETAYRAAGLLPANADYDDTAEQLLHTFKSIQNPQRRSTAIMLLKALVTEEENERRSEPRAKPS